MRSWCQAALLACLSIKWLSSSVAAETIDCYDPELCSITKRFLRFGRSMQVEDPVLRLSNGMYHPYQDKRFLRFGRSQQQDVEDYIRALLRLQTDLPQYRKRRSTANSDQSSSNESHRTKRSLVLNELQEPNEATLQDANNLMEKRDADDMDIMEDKRFMRFGRGDQDIDKRFMRFGKRFMRFGREPEQEKRFMRFGRDPSIDDKRFMRFGKKSDDELGYDDSDSFKADSGDEMDKRFMRFGKRFMRFGKSDDGAQKRFMRFGKSGADKRFMRFGKSLDQNDVDKRFMRFGKSLDGNQVDKRFMRFGKSLNLHDFDKRFMRFGKSLTENDVDKRFMRFGKSLAEDDIDKRFMRFGKRDIRSATKDSTNTKEISPEKS